MQINGVRCAFDHFAIPPTERKPNKRFSEPIAQYRVAIIENGGPPIEFVQTVSTDEQLWTRTGPESMLYSSVLEETEQRRAAEEDPSGAGRTEWS